MNEQSPSQTQFNQFGQTVYGSQTNIAGGYHLHLPTLQPSAATAPPPPHDFVGREELLMQLTTQLAAHQSPTIISLQGMDGIGKTALAQKLAQQLTPVFPGGIFWADFALHGGSIQPILREWGAICGVDLGQELDVHVLTERLRGLLTQRQNQDGPLLAMLDDVHLEPTWLATAQLLKRSLPPFTPLLLTTREEQVSAALDATIFRLDLLTESEAQELLSNRMTNASLRLSAVTVKSLLAALGYLPLAIRLAAAYLTRRGRKPGFALTDFLTQVQANAAPLLDTVTVGLETTFQNAYSALSIQQQYIFRHLSIYSSPLLTIDHVTGLLVIDTVTIESSLDALVDANLLDWDQYIPGHYLLHPLLRQYAYAQLSKQEGTVPTHRLAAEYLQELSNKRVRSPQEGLEEVDQWAKAQEWEHFIRRTCTLVGSLDRIGYWSEIEQRLIQAQSALSYLTGENVLALTAMTWNARGLIADKQAHWNDAINYYEQALEIYKQTGDSYSTAWTYNNLGVVHKCKGEWETAINRYEQALQMFEQAENRHDMAATWVNLGVVYYSKGECEKSISYYEQALHILEKAEDRFGLAQTWLGMGVVYDALGEWEKAITFYEQALTIYQQVGDVRSVATTQMNLGAAWQAKGEWEKTRSFYEQALATFQELGDYLGTAQTYGNLGIFFKRMVTRRQPLIMLLKHSCFFIRSVQPKPSQRLTT